MFFKKHNEFNQKVYNYKNFKNENYSYINKNEYQPKNYKYENNSFIFRFPNIMKQIDKINITNFPIYVKIAIPFSIISFLSFGIVFKYSNNKRIKTL